MGSNVWLLQWALLVSSLPAVGATLADYPGQYVLRLGQRPFLVLNLHQSAGGLTGTLARPSHSSVGYAISDISPDIATELIDSAEIKDDHLQFTPHGKTKAPGDMSLVLTLLLPDRASLQFLGVPVDPWILTRVPATPILFVATDWDPHRTYYPDETEQSNPEMQRIIDEDQKVRQPELIAHGNWAVIDKQDKERRTQVRALLSTDALHTGTDFGHAAFVFQHGDTPEDFLLAHTLAMVAIARGNSGALWIATATLDRYLQQIGQSQIYGTQFHSTKNMPMTQDPYNRTVISDQLRRQLGVPSQATQQKQLEGYKATSKQ